MGNIGKTLLYQRALENRDDLKNYNDNRLLLFALEMYREIEDIDNVAIDSLTDGSDDKKCDLVYIEREQGYAIIAQGYYCNNSKKKTAPANKACDLNTAVSWLFSKTFDELPDKLKAAAYELDDALTCGDIKTLELWYVHNLPESKNVAKELSIVKKTASDLLAQNYPKQVETIVAKEIGNKTIDEWYKGTQVTVLVTDPLSFKAIGGYNSKGNNWAAYSTLVSADWIRYLYTSHKKNLFSANIRDYLGSRRSDKNINNNMKETAVEEPSNFWVYNNGITAIVNDFQVTNDGDTNNIEIKGIAIVNGAQTTGVLGSLEEDLSEVFVPIRFVKCKDSNTVRRIISYNNTQNRHEAADFRSNDRVQTKLRSEFEEMLGVEYYGGRRGSDIDPIPRKANEIPSYIAGQALAAFHQEPSMAYNEKRNIWQSNSYYEKVFPEQISAGHLLFAYSLLKAVDKYKQHLRDLSQGCLTDEKKQQVNFFNLRGSVFLLVAATAASTEVILDKVVPDKFRLKWRSQVGLQDSIDNWYSIVEIISPLVNSLSKAISEGNLRNKAIVNEKVTDFRALVSTTKAFNKELFSGFAEKVDLN